MTDAVMSVAMQAGVVLNRIVFNGIESYSSLFTVPASRVRGADLIRRHVTATATVPLDRLGVELANAGLRRLVRAPEADTWSTGDGVVLTVFASAAETSDPEESMVREYASLLTNTQTLGKGLTVHFSVPAALPAVWWWRHRARSGSIAESPEIEDIIELVVRHPGLNSEVSQLPEELRDVVSAVAQRIVVDEECEWVIGRAMPDARQTPKVVNAVVDQLRQLAQV